MYEWNTIKQIIKLDIQPVHYKTHTPAALTQSSHTFSSFPMACVICNTTTANRKHTPCKQRSPDANVINIQSHDSHAVTTPSGGNN